MINPFTTPLRVFLGVVGGVAAVVVIFLSYRAFDSFQAGKRARHLATAGAQGDSAQADIKSGALLAAKADTQYVPYATYRDRPATRANPVARELGNRADAVITTLKAAVKADTSAIRHLQTQVTELQAAGPPPGPRLVPYGDIGYGFTNKHRAVPVARLGLDYRLLPHVMAKVEGAYEPPPAPRFPADTLDRGRPELRVLVAAHITFR